MPRRGKSRRDVRPLLLGSTIPKKRTALYADCPPEICGLPDRSKSRRQISTPPRAHSSLPSRNRMGKCPDTSWEDSRRIEWFHRGECETTRDAAVRKDGRPRLEMQGRARTRCENRSPFSPI